MRPMTREISKGPASGLVRGFSFRVHFHFLAFCSRRRCFLKLLLMVQMEWKIIGNNSLMHGSKLYKTLPHFLSVKQRPLILFEFVAFKAVHRRSRLLLGHLLWRKCYFRFRKTMENKWEQKRLLFVCLFLFETHPPSTSGLGLRSDNNPSPISDQLTKTIITLILVHD